MSGLLKQLERYGGRARSATTTEEHFGERNLCIKNTGIASPREPDASFLGVRRNATTLLQHATVHVLRSSDTVGGAAHPRNRQPFVRRDAYALNETHTEVERGDEVA